MVTVDATPLRPTSVTVEGAVDLMLVQVPGWSLKTDPERIERDFRFPDFAQAQAFAVQVGDLCEAEGHHAEIQYGWGHCTVGFWTHKIKGLHRNDFVAAAKTDELYAAGG